MSRVHDLITKQILRGEHISFFCRLLFSIGFYAAISFWLNAIRQTAPIWFVWVLIGVQVFFFITIFVVCSRRAKQCGFRHTWLLFIPLLLSRINDWEVIVIPTLAIIMLILSARNRNIAPEHQYLLPADIDPSEIVDDNFDAAGDDRM